jgi:hypothetical protein
MTVTVTADRDQLVEALQNRCLDLIDAVNTAAAVVLASVPAAAATDPDGCAAALGAVAALLDATVPVSALVDELDD